MEMIGGLSRTSSDVAENQINILEVNASPAHESRRIAMCRYNEGGNLEKVIVVLHDTKYLAISHTWGEAEWQLIPAFEGEILASKEKAKFIKERLHQLVGEQYFWMDILCIDQRNADARVAVTQNIPAIFQFAQRTIVIRDGTGWTPPGGDLAVLKQLETSTGEILSRHRITLVVGFDCMNITRLCTRPTSSQRVRLTGCGL
jgi:hypothetical protein